MPIIGCGLESTAGDISDKKGKKFAINMIILGLIVVGLLKALIRR
ncbi:MAG: hypothetical protein ACYCSO_06295 [Cuniculiplasma sp.]